MSEITTETKRPLYELRDNGEVHFNKKGKSQLLAKYSDNGILTFESFAIDQKHRVGISEAVIADPLTGELKGNAIKAYAIAGRPFDKKKPGEPLPPKRDKTLGDKTPEYVKWLFKWRPQAAYARYGVFLDSNGEPEIAHCSRLEQGLLKSNESGKPTKIMGDGKDALTENYLENENGILAMRQTCMTFLRKEVVGAVGDEEANDDDNEAEPVQGDDVDLEPIVETAGKPRGRGRAKTEDDEG